MVKALKNFNTEKVKKCKNRKKGEEIVASFGYFVNMTPLL
ncbi:hypothetical protein L935_03640 [Helicobacter pylori PZ5086]|nr:hypothetical protein L935_03640 [Helicobacter pylori PZ5086]